MNLTTGIIITLILGIVAAFLEAYVKEKKLWNNGMCTKCNTPFKYCRKEGKFYKLYTCKCGIRLFIFKFKDK